MKTVTPHSPTSAMVQPFRQSHYVQRGNMVPFERDGDEINIEAPLENRHRTRRRR